MTSILPGLLGGVIAYFLVNWISSFGRGKKRKRDFDLISEKLADQGFHKWTYLDLVVYIILAGITGLIFIAVLYPIYQQIIPNNIIYEDPDGLARIIIIALFFGMTAPASLWAPWCKLVHKKRARKYMLYSMANQDYDFFIINKYFIYPLCILTVIAGLLGTRTYSYIIDDELTKSDFFELTSITYKFSDIEDFLVVEKLVTLNGNVIDKLRLLVKFKDGYIWESIAVGDDFTQVKINELAKHIYEKSSVKPTAVEFSPYED